MRTWLVPLLLFAGPLWAQQASLPETVVQDIRAVSFGAGANRTTLDSAQRSRLVGSSITEWLAESSPVFVRQFGPGGLASPGTRGTASYHTALVWNGVPIQSRLFGQLDLQLVPIGPTTTATLQRGGAGALYGSGYVGGALLLGTETPQQGRSTQLTVEGGSFGTWLTAATVAARGNHTWAQVAFTHQDALNNFPFERRTASGTETVRRQHSRFASSGVQASAGWQKGAHQLALHTWWQAANRELPGPASNLGTAAETQADQALRIALTHRYTAANWQLRSTLSYVSEDLWYWFNPRLSDASSTAAFRMAFAELEYQRQLSASITWLVGLQTTHATARNSQYTATPEDRAALFTAVRYNRGALAVDASMRGAHDAGRWVLLTPTLSARYTAGQWVLRGSASRVFRLPTFNERFWPPGNPNLQPEEGYSAELGLRRTLAKGIWVEATAFQTALDGWVLWGATPEGIRPRNLQRVRSRGIELDGHLAQKWGRTRVLLTGGYTYTDATLRQSPSSQEIGRQLVHTPYHQAWGRLTLDRGRFSLGYTHRFVGVRYASLLGTPPLAPYNVATTWASYRLSLPGQPVVQLRCENTWNAAYAIQPDYPQPGRGWFARLTFSLFKQRAYDPD